MASIRRLAGNLRSCRTIAFGKIPSFSPSPSIQLPLCNRALEQHRATYGSDGAEPRLVQHSFHAMLAGFLGFGLLDVAFADSDEATATTPSPPPESPPTPTLDALEEIARKERHRLQELIKSKGLSRGSCPSFMVAVKGQKVTIRFHVPPACEVPLLIANLVSHLGVKIDDRGVGSNMMLQAWDSGVAWQLMLSRPRKQNEVAASQMEPKEAVVDDGDLCILIFRPLISSDKAEIEFMKKGSFTPEELDALASVLQLAGEPKSSELRPRADASRGSSTDKIISSLEAMGIKVFGADQPHSDQPKAGISWENIAGYNHQKREIEDTILLTLQSPELYDDIARGTRQKFETNRPRAVLFEGPPGTGKTSCARVIADQAGVPLLYVQLEVIMSKYYGESERSLGKVFSLANEIPDGAIIFLDEVDSLATARDSETHEATRRILSVLLRQIDGFEQDKKVVVVAATNRKQDLDPALLSRFDTVVTFDLPDQQTREEIAAQYAKHLEKSELAEFASATEGMSGRDIRDVCQQAERRWASKIIRGQAQKDEDRGILPPVQEYIESALSRRNSMFGAAIKLRAKRDPKRPKFDFL